MAPARQIMVSCGFAVVLLAQTAVVAAALLSSLEWPGDVFRSDKDTIVQYVSSEAWYSTAAFRRFAAYCYYNKCQHVVIHGECGYGPKMCKRLTHAAVANITGTRTVFVDNDIIPMVTDNSVMDQLCGDKPFGILCRFDQNQAIKRLTNSGIMCLDPSKAEGMALSAGTKSFVDDIFALGKCSNNARSDQLAYIKLDSKYYLDGHMHCIDKEQFGLPTSNKWRHFWGVLKLNVSEALAKLDDLPEDLRHPSIVLQLRHGTLDVVRIAFDDWRGEAIGDKANHVLGDASRPTPEAVRRIAPYYVHKWESGNVCNITTALQEPERGDELLDLLRAHGLAGNATVHNELPSNPVRVDSPNDASTNVNGEESTSTWQRQQHSRPTIKDGCLPHIALAGFAKCGTSTLYSWLTSHPRILEPLTKEPSFGFEEDDKQGFESYRSILTGAQKNATTDDLLTLDSTSHLMWRFEALSNLKRSCPDTKFIVLTCDPVKRLVSHWNYRKMGWKSEAMQGADFELAVKHQLDSLPDWLRSGKLSRLSARRLRATALDKNTPDGQWSFVSEGFYAVALLKFKLLKFSPSQLLVVTNNELFTRPAETMAKIESFLGVPHFQYPSDVFQRHLKANPFKEDTLSDSTLRLLYSLYEPHNDKLRQMFGVNIEEWTYSPEND